MTKLTVFKLSVETKEFVFSNLRILADHLKVIFPAALLLELCNQMGTVMHHKWVGAATAIPFLLLYAFFALSWHRSSLRGASSADAIDFKHLTSAEWGFIGVFFALTFLPILAITLVGFIAGFLGNLLGQIVMVLLIIAVVVGAIALSVYMIRVTFILPARAVGVKLPWREAVAVSKGALWPLIGTGLIFGIIYLIVCGLYGAVVLGTLYAVLGFGPDAATPAQGLVEFIVSIPILMASFVMTALSITALSKAYQWGMQNNPPYVKL